MARAAEMSAFQRSLLWVKVLSPGWEKQKKEDGHYLTSAREGFPAFMPLLLGSCLDLWLTQLPLVSVWATALNNQLSYSIHGVQ